jgi:transposase-like protein
MTNKLSRTFFPPELKKQIAMEAVGGMSADYLSKKYGVSRSNVNAWRRGLEKQGVSQPTEFRASPEDNLLFDAIVNITKVLSARYNITIEAKPKEE